MRRLLAICFVSTLFLPVLSGVAYAQPDLRATLIEFPAWLGRDATLRISIRVTNRGDAPAEDLRVAISIHEAIQTRSQLELTFRGRLGQSVGSDTLTVEGSLAAGATRTITVEKPLREISFFRSAPEDRAYPLRITVRSGRVASNPLDTHMLYFVNPAAEPLAVGMILPIHVAPVHSPSLRMTERAERLGADIQDGTVGEILDAIDGHPNLPIALAPSGLFLDTLNEMSRGFSVESASSPRPVTRTDSAAIAASQALERLRSAAGRPNVEWVTMPYSAANLLVLGRELSPIAVSSQISSTATRARESLSLSQQPSWVLPTPNVIDEPTLTVLESSGTTRIILSSGSMRARRTPLTPSAPARLRTRVGVTTAIVTDQGLSQRAAGASDPQVDPVRARQRFLAETLAIFLERPALRRAVAFVTPAEWRAPTGHVAGILDALAVAPWLRPATPSQILEQVQELSDAELASTEDLLEDISIPSDDYFRGLRAARDDIDRFAEVSPPQEMLAALERRLLIAESSSWWNSRREIEQANAFVDSIDETVVREFQKVSAPASLTITLTSTNGTIPLSIINRATYPMDVVLRLDSSQLRFPKGSACPGGKGTCIPLRRLQPRAQTVEVEALARGTGTSRLFVKIQTPTSRSVMAQSELSVRSTAYNVVGVVMTVGAGVFLIAWPILGLVRRRNAK